MSLTKIGYVERLTLFKSELNQHERYKKKQIVELANLAEKEGVAKEEINQKLCEDLKGFITKQYVGQCLPDEFKHKNKLGKLLYREEEEELEEKEPIAITNDGSVVPPVDLEEKIADEVKEEFSTTFKNVLESRKAESSNINDIILRELDEKRQQVAELQEKLEKTPTKFEETEQYVQMKSLTDRLKQYSGIPIIFSNGNFAKAFKKDSFTAKTTIEIQNRQIPILVDIRHSTESVISCVIDKQEVKRVF